MKVLSRIDPTTFENLLQNSEISGDFVSYFIESDCFERFKEQILSFLSSKLDQYLTKKVEEEAKLSWKPILDLASCLYSFIKKFSTNAFMTSSLIKFLSKSFFGQIFLFILHQIHQVFEFFD